MPVLVVDNVPPEIYEQLHCWANGSTEGAGVYAVLDAPADVKRVAGKNGKEGVERT